MDIGLSKNAFLSTEEEAKDKPFKEGQEVLVQVSREPVGDKGAKVTTRFSLAGRFAVLLPKNKNYLGVSASIKDVEERERLLKLGQQLKPREAGLILRTLAAGVTEKELLEDINRLCEIQKEIALSMEGGKVKGLLYNAVDPFSRLVREGIDDSVDEIIIDDGELAQQLRAELQRVKCSAAKKVWTDFKGRLFERYGVQAEIENALRPKVELESGGYLIIEQTEALVVIDVNSGKYTGEKTRSDTLLALNLEAGEEILRQIKLRNLSGIIIVDFIDMKRSEDWRTLMSFLEETALRKKTKCHIVGQTKLGLVEITRKKEGQTLEARYTDLCPHCSGRGRLPGKLDLDHS